MAPLFFRLYLLGCQMKVKIDGRRIVVIGNIRNSDDSNELIGYMNDSIDTIVLFDSINITSRVVEAVKGSGILVETNRRELLRLLYSLNIKTRNSHRCASMTQWVF